MVDLRTGDVSKLPRSIAGVAFDCCFSVSPDGSRVAFVGMVGTSDDRWPGRYGVVVANVDGSELRVVARDALDASKDRPEWSPDGTKIVFERESDGAPVVVDVTTRVVTPITDAGASTRSRRSARTGAPSCSRGRSTTNPPPSGPCRRREVGNRC